MVIRGLKGSGRPHTECDMDIKQKQRVFQPSFSLHLYGEDCLSVYVLCSHRARMRCSHLCSIQTQVLDQRGDRSSVGQRAMSLGSRASLSPSHNIATTQLLRYPLRGSGVHGGRQDHFLCSVGAHQQLPFSNT